MRNNLYSMHITCTACEGNKLKKLNDIIKFDNLKMQFYQGRMLAKPINLS